MPLQRRQMLSCLAATATVALTACGGGGDGGFDRPLTRFMWLLNINPEVASADVRFGADTIATALRFPELTARVEIEFGAYSFTVLNRANNAAAIFDNVVVNGDSPELTVFYRKGNSVGLGASPLGIVNYFDSTETLVAELDDGAGVVQVSRLAFEAAAPQVSRSPNCRLRLRRASDRVLVYDSGLRFREDAILIFPADATTGLVSAAGLSYDRSNAQLVVWPNIL